MIPGIVDFELIREALRTPIPQTPGAYRFGCLSHHSFFSRHHPHPQHVTHIQGRAGGGKAWLAAVGRSGKLEREDPAPVSRLRSREDGNMARVTELLGHLQALGQAKTRLGGQAPRAGCTSLQDFSHCPISHFTNQKNKKG